jgi:hypothetical protein
MKVAHWNVCLWRYEGCEEPDAPGQAAAAQWAVRLRRVGERVLALDADVVSLVDVGYPDRVIEAVTPHGYSHVYAREAGGEGGVLVLFRRARLRLTNMHVVELSSDAFPAVACVFVDSAGRVMVFAATRLDGAQDSKGVLTTELRALLDMLGAFEEMSGAWLTVVCAGLDAGPSAPMLGGVWEAGFSSALALDDESRFTWHARRDDGGVDHGVADYILLRRADRAPSTPAVAKWWWHAQVPPEAGSRVDDDEIGHVPIAALIEPDPETTEK